MATNVGGFIPTIVSARFLRTLSAMYVWASLANRNYEQDAAGGGNKVKIPTSTTSITVGDYVVGSDMADAAEVAGSVQEMTLDKQKFFHFLVDDIEEFQSSPDIMEETVKQAALKVSGQVDADLRSTFEGGYAASRSQRVTDELSAGDWGKKFLIALSNLGRDMSKAQVPLTERWVVLHPDTIAAIEQYFTAQPASGTFQPATADSTIRNGFVGRLLNFTVYSTTEVTSTTVGAVNYWRQFAGQGTNAVTFAEQIAQVESYRPALRFGDAVKGLYVYGSRLVESASLFSIENRKA